MAKRYEERVVKGTFLTLVRCIWAERASTLQLGKIRYTEVGLPRPYEKQIIFDRDPTPHYCSIVASSGPIEHVGFITTRS